MALHPFFLPKVKSSSSSTIKDFSVNRKVPTGISELEKAEFVEHKKPRCATSLTRTTDDKT